MKKGVDKFAFNSQKNVMENCLGYDELLLTVHNLIDSQRDSTEVTNILKRDGLTLKEDNENLIKENKRLTSSMESLKEVNENLIKDNSRLTSSKESLKEDNENLIKENSRLSSSKESLKEDNEYQHGKVIDDKFRNN